MDLKEVFIKNIILIVLLLIVAWIIKTWSLNKKVKREENIRNKLIKSFNKEQDIHYDGCVINKDNSWVFQDEVFKNKDKYYDIKDMIKEQGK
ncbi:hypothetical protein [Sulfurimonas sp.]|uniref:hypothetical protein n=1 Tax=Sulfurimonas sp. TaxID=2022749 RepID=UPI0025FCABDD|nr:hypothetical protein [Sulfurimonas sp.]